MPIDEVGTDVEDLTEGADLEFLKAAAVAHGVSPGEMAKRGIQKIFSDRTRPRIMPGTIQAFGSRPRK